MSAFTVWGALGIVAGAALFVLGILAPVGFVRQLLVSSGGTFAILGIVGLVVDATTSNKCSECRGTGRCGGNSRAAYIAPVPDVAGTEAGPDAGVPGRPNPSGTGNSSSSNGSIG